jgi:hypothetical protein
MYRPLGRTNRSCGWLLAAGHPAGRGAMARRLSGRTLSCEALRGARAQLDPAMLHQSMPGRDLCDQMPSPCITPPLREQPEQRHRHYPHEVTLRRGSHMGIHRVRAREITHLWRRRIEEDVAWHRVSPACVTPVTAALFLFQTPDAGSWVTAWSKPAPLLWTLATMVCYSAGLDGGVPEK